MCVNRKTRTQYFKDHKMSDHRYKIQGILCQWIQQVYLNTKKYYVNYQLHFTGKYPTFLMQDAL
jgi:hypothetical protein